MPLPRMRTATGVLSEIKSQDPKSEVTLHYIRHIIHTQQVPVVPVGRKKLVNVDAVIDYLNGSVPVKEPDPGVGKIRSITM